ncbi:hypothetical protein NQ318_007274 [Aromia moschata]|uniref:Peptidase S1 domain-containing protein n=1 Tax=Aromia moschata TaxID=1265417 RepID=A0AAV8YZE7_9CUCU|nr:hypothetical protein NQ318_007274 [Aromia moschata]
MMMLSNLKESAATKWVSLSQHVSPSPSNRIIGGDEATPHEFPFMVGLLINGNAFCGGTLISENYVLTAAHCGVVISRVTVILGAHNVSAEEDTQNRIAGASVLVHEEYNSTSFQNDVALIKLSEPATLNENIQLAKLPARADADEKYVDDTTTGIGWGLFEDVFQPTINDISSTLRYVNVSVLLLSDCGEYYNDYVNNMLFVTENNVCTSGYKNRGTCNGDSGGPLIHDGTQIGIVSIGTQLCEVCSPSIYTNVGRYLDWIEDNSDVVIS